MRKIFIVLFCVVFLGQAAPFVCADDDLLVQNTTPDSSGWFAGTKDWWKNRQNRKACEAYIKEYKKTHPNDYQVMIIDDSGNPRIESSPNATGKNRVVYVVKDMDTRGFLECVDGSAVGTDRRLPDRQLNRTIYCGSHGDKSGKGPKSFVDELSYKDSRGNQVDAAGAPAWQKTVTNWERDLAAQGKTPQGLFTGNAVMEVQVCRAANGKFPRFMANEMPAGGKVIASTEDTQAGGYGVIGSAKFYMKPGSERIFSPIEKTNSQITSEEEIAYLAHKYDKIRSQFEQAQRGEVTHIKEYQNGMALKFEELLDNSGHFEQAKEIDGLRGMLSEAKIKAYRGEMTVADMDAISSQMSQTLTEKGSMDDYYELKAAEALPPEPVGIPSSSSPATPLIVQPSEPVPGTIPEGAPSGVVEPPAAPSPIIPDQATLTREAQPEPAAVQAEPEPEITTVDTATPEVAPAAIQVEHSASYDRLRERRQARQDRLEAKTPPPPPEAPEPSAPPVIVAPPVEKRQWSTGALMKEGAGRYMDNLRDKIQAGRQSRGQQQADSQAYQAQAAEQHQMQMQQAQAMMQQVGGSFKTFNAMNQAYNQQQSAPTVPHTSAGAAEKRSQPPKVEKKEMTIYEKLGLNKKTTTRVRVNTFEPCYTGVSFGVKQYTFLTGTIDIFVDKTANKAFLVRNYTVHFQNGKNSFNDRSDIVELRINKTESLDDWIWFNLSNLKQMSKAEGGPLVSLIFTLYPKKGIAKNGSYGLFVVFGYYRLNSNSPKDRITGGTRVFKWNGVIISE